MNAEFELEIFKNNILYPLDKKMGISDDTWDHSLLFEWVSPINKIVINSKTLIKT